MARIALGLLAPLALQHAGDVGERDVVGAHLLVLVCSLAAAGLPAVDDGAICASECLGEGRLLVDFEGDVFGINHGWSAGQPVVAMQSRRAAGTGAGRALALP